MTPNQKKVFKILAVVVVVVVLAMLIGVLMFILKRRNAASPTTTTTAPTGGIPAVVPARAPAAAQPGARVPKPANSPAPAPAPVPKPANSPATAPAPVPKPANSPAPAPARCLSRPTAPPGARPGARPGTRPGARPKPSPEDLRMCKTGPVNNVLVYQVCKNTDTKCDMNIGRKQGVSEKISCQQLCADKGLSCDETYTIASWCKRDKRSTDTCSRPRQDQFGCVCRK